jgi:eukaryotic-like serine/threonine-protein kinase
MFDSPSRFLAGFPALSPHRLQAMSDKSEQTQRAQRLVGSTLIDKWRLDSLIGVGGMAAVYAATHRNGKRAAIKLLHPQYALDTALRNRFLREGHLANKVEHAGVCSVLDDNASDDGVFLVMELLEGKTLKQHWAAGGNRMDTGEVVRIADRLLDVLAAAHEKGIVHRDLKPENIFLTTQGEVKILDFGIARLLEMQKSEVTRTGAMMGTPAFMSPEQARARWEWVDGRSDLWALGATMFGLISGELVHAAGTVPELLVAAATQKARSIRSVMPSVPGDVAEVIDRALAFEKEDRWPDARAMQGAIRRVMAGGRDSARPPPSFAIGPSRVESSMMPTLAGRPPSKPNMPAVKAPRAASPSTPPSQRITTGPQAAPSSGLVDAKTTEITAFEVVEPASRRGGEAAPAPSQRPPLSPLPPPPVSVRTPSRPPIEAATIALAEAPRPPAPQVVPRRNLSPLPSSYVAPPPKPTSVPPVSMVPFRRSRRPLLLGAVVVGVAAAAVFAAVQLWPAGQRPAAAPASQTAAPTSTAAPAKPARGRGAAPRQPKDKQRHF